MRAVEVKQPPLPWQNANDVSALPDIRLDAEIRDVQTLFAQSGWFNLSSPTYEQAVLILLVNPAVVTIPPSSQYAPLDVMVIDQYGVIKEIYPNLMLAELAEPITSQNPALGILFLRGNAHQTLKISPGDSVVHQAFKKPPAMLSLPETVAPANSQ
ncbi:MAG: hypothetical protein ACK5XN_16905 [Bacteroidota bacterium]